VEAVQSFDISIGDWVQQPEKEVNLEDFSTLAITALELVWLACDWLSRQTRPLHRYQGLFQWRPKVTGALQLAVAKNDHAIVRLWELIELLIPAFARRVGDPEFCLH
jgi:hypothetical protein